MTTLELFNDSEYFEKEIEPLVKKLNELCYLRNIPLFIDVCFKRGESSEKLTGEEYCSYIVTGGEDRAPWKWAAYNCLCFESPNMLERISYIINKEEKRE